MTAPIVSAVMAVYNGERFVAEAIESMLSQTRPPDQVIVVDDGSTDRTAEIVRGFASVEYVHQPNAGQAAALNVGIAHARGELLCFLDADDLWPRDRLALQLAAFEEQPELEIVYGHAEQFRHGASHSMPPQPAPAHSGMLVRAASLARVGAFNPSYRLAAVFDWSARAQAGGLRTRMLSAVVLRRRIHDANAGILRKHERDEYLRVVKAAMDRRRGIT